MNKVFTHARIALLAALLPFGMSACAPDAWRSDSPYEAFLDQVQQKCWNLDIGGREINGLLSGSSGATSSGEYFIDLTSRMFNGQISADNYAETLAAFYNTKPDSPGIRCVLAQMPENPQRLAPLIKY
jgi:hypothetical protein